MKDKPVVYRNKTREEKLRIARMAYREIKEAIENWEDSTGIVCCHWDECITVEDEFFKKSELRESNDR